MTEYAVINGELRQRYGDSEGLPVHAYLPMRGVNWEGLKFIEDPPVAYLNQMQAKRIAKNAKARAKRGHGIDRKGNSGGFAPLGQIVDYTKVVGITIK
jgi:hypothetical protein